MTAAVQALRAEVRTHPWRSLGYAAIAGACVAARRSRDPLLRTAARTAISIAIGLLREAAIEGVIDRARSWFEIGHAEGLTDQTRVRSPNSRP